MTNNVDSPVYGFEIEHFLKVGVIRLGPAKCAFCNSALPSFVLLYSIAT